MTARDLSTFTTADLADPDIDPATLAQLAQARPDLWAAILTNPKCYPELAAWIRRQMPDDPAAPHTMAHPPVTTEQWTAQFQETNHREPTVSEFQTAVAAGRIIGDRKPHDPSAQQMAAGAKQMAAGAKSFFSHRIAPVAADTARSVQKAINARSSQPSGTASLMSLAPLALAVTAFLALLSLFLPVASGFGMSFNFFDEEAGGEGMFLLVVMLFVIAAAITAFFTRKRWASITAGVVGIIAGLFGAIDSFGTMANINDIRGASISAGAVLLALLSVLLLLIAVVTLLPQPRQRPAPTAQ